LIRTVSGPAILGVTAVKIVEGISWFNPDGETDKELIYLC
jgi:hypothetical protein